MKAFILISLIIASSSLLAQESVKISEMKWNPDFTIHIKFSNDSTLIQDVKALYHVNEHPGTKKEFTYYPVSLDARFVNNLISSNFKQTTNSQSKKENEIEIKTLWNTIHPSIGGGFIHFINSLIYTIESNSLSLYTPLMKRPESNWKPNPVTESYTRTKNWEYYIPHTMKLAQKEYYAQNKKNELGDIKILPPNFIELFLNTNDKQYKNLAQQKEFNKTATIDMVRLLVGSKYLGNEQIDYIQGAVINAIMSYNKNNLPSVIVFDNYNAAAAMTLDEKGYKIENIVFNNEVKLSEEETNNRLSKINMVINEINEANKKVFEEKLKTYYTN